MRRTNPIYTKAEDGSLTAVAVTRYVTNLHFLLQQTPANLERARDRARDRGDEALAQHFDDKKAEEVGHDSWAEHDIAQLSPLARVPVTRQIASTMLDLVAFIGALIEEDPVLYLAYILFVEQLTSQGGSEWLELLETRCGIPRASMTAVGKHAELDREHVEEALESIDALVADPKKLDRLRRVVDDSITHFERFCAEVTAVPVDHADIASRHVTAA